MQSICWVLAKEIFIECCNYRAHALYNKTQLSSYKWFICMKVHINNELLISSYITIVIILMYRQLFITMHLWNADIHTSLAVKFSMHATM